MKKFDEQCKKILNESEMSFVDDVIDNFAGKPFEADELIRYWIEGANNINLDKLAKKHKVDRKKMAKFLAKNYF